MHRIPIFVEGRIGLVGSPRFEEWKLLRWAVPDGESISGETIIAEIECEIAVVEHEVFYNGSLRHLISEGERFTNGMPIGTIECTESEFAEYLASQSARRICITIDSKDLQVVERLKGDEANEDFALRVFREGLKKIDG